MINTRDSLVWPKAGFQLSPAAAASVRSRVFFMMNLFTAQKANIEQEFFSGIDDPNASGRDKLGVQRIEK